MLLLKKSAPSSSKSSSVLASLGLSSSKDPISLNSASPLPSVDPCFSENKLIPELTKGSLLKPPQGLSSGYPILDQTLFGGGLPKSGISLWVAPPGLGATRLWIKTYEGLRQLQSWTLWVETSSRLCPQQLWRQGVRTDFLYVIRSDFSGEKSEQKKFLQILQEALSFHVFSLIGVQIESLSSLKNSLQKLKYLAEEYSCSLVFLSSEKKDLRLGSFFDLALEFQTSAIKIHRAKNRPTQSISWSHPYGSFLSAPPPILTSRAG